MTHDLNFWRNLALNKQGLDGRDAFGTGPDGVETAIKALGYIQIDTLNVIERAHHHTLWNRVSDYKPDHLDQLLGQQKIFEHWHHALSYLPIDDYRFAIPFMERMRAGKTPYYKTRDTKLMTSLIERIKVNGPLRLRDFKEDKAHKQKKNAWNSRPVKRALEVLFLQGDLMVARREKMERVYDLTENVLPSHISTRSPTEAEYADYLIKTTLHANGFASLDYILHGKSTAPLKKEVQRQLDEAVRAGEIEQHDNIYALPNILETSLQAKEGNIKILSPFDNAVINRDRAQNLFNFSYRLECYTPQAKRQYGYFCLPILYENQLVGRADCKALRKEGVLNVLSIYFEKKITDPDSFFAALAEELQRSAQFNQCDTIQIEKASPHKFKTVLKKALKANLHKKSP
ncbi:crosslink repair DNA glycosylase YcaQ family protein [Terasakiella sp. A23]|uniref:winged helix-turn-helix domain-containing protein n=1 Tax=Terasakiella sp. FCG-A23 TaxID=3080561 RepID=UPI002952D891|nr:crosslink repair DNA glycosylase YcaQ family protein [Terasakiella sp. A23]MDV7338637.1 crosslink repair DNA glycosylase YcaQ family protein [Terasakiella sp. A23]